MILVGGALLILVLLGLVVSTGRRAAFLLIPLSAFSLTWRGLLPTESTLIAADAVLAIVLVCGFLFLRPKPDESRSYFVSGCLFAFLVVCVLSCFSGTFVVIQWFQLAAYSLLFGYTLLFDTLLGSPEADRIALSYWNWATLIVATLGLIGVVTMVAGYDTFLWHSQSRLRASFQMPNQLASFLLLVTPFSITVIPHLWKGRRLLAVGLFCLLMLLMVVSGSRAGLGSMVLSSLALAIFSRNRVLIGGACLVGTLFALGSFMRLPSERADFFLWRFSYISTQFSGTGEAVVPSDFHAIQRERALKVFLRYPVFGSGIGAFDVRERELVADDQFTGWEVHNTWLGLLAETGVAGLAICCILVCTIAFRAWQLRKYGAGTLYEALGVAALSSMVGLALFSNFHFLFRFRHIWLFFCLVNAAHCHLMATVARRSSHASLPELPERRLRLPALSRPFVSNARQ